MIGKKKKGEVEVMLISSLDTGRWIIPKGWPIEGKDAAGAALQEAWEEAGVRKGRVTGGALGSYAYDKELDTVRNNFLIKKLGLSDGPELMDAINSVIETYGKSERNKYRAVIYYMLTKHFGKEAVYG